MNNTQYAVSCFVALTIAAVFALLSVAALSNGYFEAMAVYLVIMFVSSFIGIRFSLGLNYEVV
jgi:uncharacterized membrane protein